MRNVSCIGFFMMSLFLVISCTSELDVKLADRLKKPLANNNESIKTEPNLKTILSNIDGGVYRIIDKNGSYEEYNFPAVAESFSSYTRSSIMPIKGKIVLFFVEIDTASKWAMYSLNIESNNLTRVREFDYGDGDPGDDTYEPIIIGEVGDRILFAVKTQTYGMELWKTDGTNLGTTLVKDINNGGSDGFKSFIGANKTDVVYFSAFSSTAGEEIWRSDGTETGTSLLADFNPGISSSTPNLAFSNENIIVIVADNGTKKTIFLLSLLDENIKSVDGLHDFSFFSSEFVADNKLYIKLDDDITPTDKSVYIVDLLTQAVEKINITQVSHIYDVKFLGELNNDIYFYKRDDATDNVDFYKTSGSNASTILTTNFISDNSATVRKILPPFFKIDEELFSCADFTSTSNTNLKCFLYDGSSVVDVTADIEALLVDGFSPHINGYINFFTSQKMKLKEEVLDFKIYTINTVTMKRTESFLKYQNGVFSLVAEYTSDDSLNAFDIMSRYEFPFLLRSFNNFNFYNSLTNDNYYIIENRETADFAI